MIKSTFYNLSEEKRKRLFEAAQKEFSSVSYHDASINKIIKNAEISRGSFYMYFDDKYDLVIAMLEDYRKIIEKRVKEVLVESNGDIFEMAITLFDETLFYSNKKELDTLFHNLFQTIHTNVEPGEERKNFNMEQHNHVVELVSLINRDLLRLEEDAEFYELMDLIFLITRKSMVKAMSKKEPLEEARLGLLRKLNIIKYGVNKK